MFSKWCHSTRKALKAELWYILKQGWTFFSQNKNPKHNKENILFRIMMVKFKYFKLRRVFNLLPCNCLLFYAIPKFPDQSCCTSLHCVKLNSAKACERSGFTFSWNFPSFATWLKVTISYTNQVELKRISESLHIWKIDVSREHTAERSSEYHTVLKTCSLNLSVKAPSWNSAVYSTLKRLLYL